MYSRLHVHLCNNLCFIRQAWNGAGEEDSKRRKMDIKLESEDANFAFPEVAHATSPDSKTASRGTSNGIGGLATISGSRTGNGSSGRVVEVSRTRPGLGVLSKRTSTAQRGPITLTSQLCTSCDTCLLLLFCFFLPFCFFCFSLLLTGSYTEWPVARSMYR